MPNGGLSSLAGNLDQHHRVAVADLILAQRSVRTTVEKLVAEWEPQVLGLSVMTFQRRTAFKIIQLVRALRPDVRVVVGGYDPSLAPDPYMAPETGVDFIVRGEGEVTFCELIRALENGRAFESIGGLTYREPAGDWRHNPQRPVHGLDNGDIRLPKRSARVLQGYTMLGKPIDVIETSRGCTFDCSFCSIIAMRGRNFHPYAVDRVLADIRDARDHGARAIFLVDDNITLNVRRFAALCQAIIDAGLHHLDYTVQAMTAPLAQHGETLAPLMRQAGFRYVFLGIENILDENLTFLRARAKNQHRAPGQPVGNATRTAIDALHRHNMYVIGGMIVGNPDDTREAIAANLAFARRYVDWPYIQHPTPYPGTPMTQDFRARGLIINEHLEDYDGTTAVVRTEHVPAEEVEFLRWRAERWMKVRHMGAAVLHDPWFIISHAPGMLAHTFRGCSVRSTLGFEDEHNAFKRYKAIRHEERKYL